MISGVRSDVAVKLYGDDLEVLATKAKELPDVLESIDGSADVSAEQVSGEPVLQVRVRQDQIARYGVRARTVILLVESLAGRSLGEVVEGQFRFPLVARLPERFRASPEAV